ncbi:MAG: hypothetical protein ACI8P2_005126, partial [Candidatus Latescibacterota bacterium]
GKKRAVALITAPYFLSLSTTRQPPDAALL